jgi:DNA polymerase III subunit delta
MADLSSIYVSKMAKTTLTPSGILSNVKAGNLKPVYYLAGEESFFIDAITDGLLEILVSEIEREFDLNVVYGKDTDMRQVVTLAKQYPMLAKYKVILVREAQDIKDLENLSLYLERPMPTSILIFSHKNGTLDKRKKTAQDIERVGLLYESKKMYENELPSWILQQAKDKGMLMDERSAFVLAEFLGNDLSRINGEILKLKLNISGAKNRITPDLIEQNIGISREFNDFELQSAIASKNTLKANKIANYYGKNPRSNPIQKTLSLLGGYFGNLMLFHYLVDKSPAHAASELGTTPFRIKELSEGARNYSAAKTMQIISLLRTYDAKSKGFESRSIPDIELLKELIYKILH